MKVRIHIRKFSHGALRNTLRTLEAGFLIAGCTAVGISAWAFLEAKWFQATEMARFDDMEANSVARTDVLLKLKLARPSLEWSPRNGVAFSKIEVSRLGIAAMVVEGIDGHDLKVAVGHVPGTALPGEPGNVAIAGHRDTFFRSLARIHINDRITLTTLQGSYDYAVESMRIVAPSAVEFLAPTERPTLTLITCYPFSYTGSAPLRFIVRARQRSAASARSY